MKRLVFVVKVGGKLGLFYKWGEGQVGLVFCGYGKGKVGSGFMGKVGGMSCNTIPQPSNEHISNFIYLLDQNEARHFIIIACREPP